MGKKAKLVVLTLVVATMMYPIALYSSIKRYEAWMQTKIQRVPPDVRQWIDFDPYIRTRDWAWFLSLGSILASCWVTIISKHGIRGLFNL